MNIRMRKWSTGALAAALALSLAACSSDNNGGNDGGNVSNAANAKNDGAANAGGDNAANAGNAGNAPALNENEPGWKQDTSPITFDWYMNFSWGPSSWGENLVSKYITKKTGVNIKFIVPAGNENEKLNTMIASGKMPDFITLDWANDGVKQLIESGLVLPLNELGKEYDPYFFKVADEQKLSWYAQPDGNSYGYPNFSSSPNDYQTYGKSYTSNQTFLVRKDMYEAIGKPDMRTPEGFLNALKAAKEKFPKVNGQPLIPIGLTEFGDDGSYSFLGGTKLDSMLQNFLAIPMEKGGKLYDRTTDPEFVKWLKVFRQANQDGLLPKDVFIDKRPQIDEKVTQGRYFAMLYQAGDMSGPNGERYKKDPNSAYIAIDGPANSNLDTPTLSGPSIAGWTLTLISKDVKDKARAIRFLSYMLSEEGQKDNYLGEKGVTYDTIEGKDQFLPAITELKQKDPDKYGKEYGLESGYWMLYDFNQNLQWALPPTEPDKQWKDWTQGKITNFSAFDLINPSGQSEEGIAANKIAMLWGDYLPKMLLSKSEDEFDIVFNEFIEKRNALGFEKVMAYRQARYEENIKKLGQ
ncbi:putative aldouronate transport system substrate-binding protein [Paenibacillus sp. UNC496MF]|uniref:extracellular solute-binding protein n=1 Tax=Paenibacillus sp. UNC496MF TaxID=1502753 RepID=UPI0008E396CC|nr:extracellular solute-binding protein [Paenibacillus sp. UNC496MF]SFJ53985.1 putative aldouronate transport system substrate-binding protein [Paenibacillus sp. UNC496MF]